jgi:multidrug efflux pump subunit AcrB/ABC-type multidrug transport system ATPase subunit
MSSGNFIIQRKTLISMLFAGLMLLGIISMRRLPVELLPDIELPFLMVFVRSSVESDPASIEKEVIIPLEGAIGTMEGIEEIESFAGRSSGRIEIYFRKGTDIKYAYLKLEERINSIRGSIPEEYFVFVFKIDTEQISNQLMELQVRGGGGLDRVRYIVDTELAKEFESIDGIASVDITGGREKSVEILLDDSAYDAYGITPSRITSLIVGGGADNVSVGTVKEKGKKYYVNVVSEYLELSDLKNIVVNPTGPVLLGDIADISFGVMKQESISRINGKETVSMRLVKDQLVNLIELSDHTLEVVDRLNREFAGKDIEIAVLNDAADPIRKNIDLIVRLAIIGGLLAIAILWLFLRNIRMVLVIALAIPVSIYTAFNFFYAAGISINSLTLIGMALAVGMLLDNSVVVLENIFRLISEGKGTDRAVIQGVGEVWRAIVAATATTVTVFLPFVFSSNFILRTLGKHIGVSIISTLVVSLAAALLLIPMVTHLFLSRSGRAGDHPHTRSGQGRPAEIYNVIIKTCMRYPGRTIVSTIIVFFVSIIVCLGLSVQSSEDTETGSFDLYVIMPKGSTLDLTDLAVSDLEERLSGIEEKEDIRSNIYEDEATITVKLKEDFGKIAGRSLDQIKEDARKRIGDFRSGEVTFEQPQSSRRFRGGRGGMGRMGARFFGLGSQQESIVIKGADFDRMRRFAENLKGYIDDLPSTSETGIDVTSNHPEVHLLHDMRLMSYFGLSLQSVRSGLASLPAEITSRATFKQGTDEYEIIVKSNKEEERGMPELRALPLSSGSGEVLRLEDVSRIIYSEGMTEIHRINQEKQIEITYSFIDEINDSRRLVSDARYEIEQMVDNLVIPSGIAVEIESGDSDVSEFKFLIFAAFILIYMILASVFESLTTPIVMMFTIPLAAIGSLWLLIFTKTSILDPYTLTGFLILLGIVVNNGIILIDYSLILRRRGYRRSRALLMAGQARARPILITAITTIAAMVPLAMGKTEEVMLIGAPFAITVIGGLVVGTLFTLVFIPVVYSGLENALTFLKHLDRRIRLIQATAFAGGAYLVWYNIDTLVWRSAFIVALILLIPALTWLILSSLRRASAAVIDSGSGITISVRNLVKIYDQPSRFVREWNKGKRIRQRTGERPADPGALIWQVPLLCFMGYFIYFYLRSYFWAFLTSHILYFYTFHISRNVPRLPSRSRPVFMWGFPLVNLAVFYLKWKSIPLTIITAVLWFSLLVIFNTSRKLHEEKINIARIEGRFSGIKRAFFRFVLMIPLVGKRRIPFKALGGVSMEIGSGMFGLLGPNGAGKTTLMRMICGIFEQSYGKIHINGIDTAEKREELQGLIGYLPQEFGTYENMTAREFLDYQAMLKGITGENERRETVDFVMGRVHIDEYADRKIGSFSGGMKQRVGIAQTLLHLPRILVVDEPTAGLDPRERIRFRNLLVELSRDRVVIFSTHIIEDIYSSCNKVAVLNRGRLLYLDDPARMTETAEGKVWQFHITPRDFEDVRKENLVVHHMRDGEMIRVRCLAAGKPVPDAQEVKPTLEDAYLWLLKESGNGNGDGGNEEEQ